MTIHLSPWTDLAAVLAAGFFVVFVGFLLLLRFWKFERGADVGDGVRKLQKNPVLRIGGLPIFLIFLAAFSFVHWFRGDASGGAVPVEMAALGVLIFLLGFLDDLFGVPAKLKLLVQVGVGFGAYYAGMRIEVMSNPFGSGQVDLGHFGLLLTVIWFVALPNLINLIDGMDGLAGGICLFLMGTLSVLCLITGHFALALICVAVFGGLIAFLCFNLPPAKVYMGDGGAYFLGFLIASASLISSSKGSIFGALLVVVIALGFPILDTLLAITRRALSGLPIMAPDARHLHHRLMTLGFSKRTILMLLYGVMAGLCLIGLSLFISKGYLIPILGMGLLMGLFLGLRFVGFPRSIGECKTVLRDIVAARKDIRYAYSLAQVLEHEVDRLKTADEYWDSLLVAMAKLGIEPAGDSQDAAKLRGPERCAVIYSISTERAWHLYCPVPSSRRRQWDRVIRCFVPALMTGEAKYQSVPKSFGLFRGETANVFADLENLLNGEAPAVTEKEKLPRLFKRISQISKRIGGKEEAMVGFERSKFEA